MEFIHQVEETRYAEERTIRFMPVLTPINDADASFPLHRAIRRYKGNLRKIRSILMFGVNINVINKGGETVLHEAVLNFNCDVNLVKILLDFEPTLINCIDSEEKSALHLAMLHNGNDAVVKELLKRGAEVNAKDVFGETPLHIAAHTGHSSFTILLKFGADVNARNLDEDTPLHSAVQGFCKYSTLNRPLIRALLARGAHVNALNMLNETPLHTAVRNEGVTKKCIQFLLKWGANPNLQNGIKYTSIFDCEKREIGELLIQHSILLNLKNSVSVTNNIIGSEVLNLDYCRNDEEYCLWTTTRDLCLKDMMRMTSDQISSDTTLFEFISMRYNRKNIKFNFFEFISVLSRFIYNSYPSCKDILSVCIKRRDLLNILSYVQIYAKNSSPCSSGKKETTILNIYCIEHLAKYLSNYDLICLILAYVEHEIL